MKSQKPIFIIEHLEPELYEWCLIEYKHISKIAGKSNLWFTNIKTKDANKLLRYGFVFRKSVKSLSINNACILDSESNIQLTPKIAKLFKYFIFGGILGDYPAKKRTKQELTEKLNFPSYNLGKAQMSTDNAVYTVKQIISGKDLKNLPCKDNIEIPINKIESTILPYKYALINNKPLISRGLTKYLKKNKFQK